ncbi:hypothetical protein MVES_002410 [Malassezia vespertilionis]|uniref:Uncharacterized protein n=1 Tax=Malassezia vespertilionis TaxID=2020962 RepID=A0A2N1JAA0_9BASI|nr:hypothetical protein MVES_002410 [Malassezia vespertilionis]
MSQDSKLHLACLDGKHHILYSCEGKIDLVQQYLDEDISAAQLNEQDADGRAPLHWAASDDAKLNIAKALLNTGKIDVDAPDHGGWTPVMIASSAGASQMLDLLLAHGASPHAVNNRKISALHYAASKNHAEIARALLVAGADANAQDGALQRPIHRAASAGHNAMIRTLLAPPPRADGSAHPKTRVNAVDRLGNTPLHLALDSGNQQTTAVLIGEGGADRTRPNADGILAEEMEGVGGQEQNRIRDFIVASFGAL